MNQQDLKLAGYNLFCNLDGRGVALYIKESIRSSEVKLEISCEASIWCEVQLRGQDVLMIGVLYRSPNSTDQESNEIIMMIAEAVSMRSSHLLIMGDMNFPGIDWSVQTSNGTLQEQHFIENFREWFLWQHSVLPTRYRNQQKANILDLVMTNEERMVDVVNVNEPLGKSDHATLDWILRCYADDAQTRVKKYLYDKGDFDAIRESIAVDDWPSILLNKSAEEQWTVISEKLEKLVATYVPYKRCGNIEQRQRRAAWMNIRVLSRIKRKKEAFEIYKETRDGKAYLEYAKARNAAKAETRRAVRDYEREIAKQAKKNPKAFYRFVNGRLKTRAKIADLKTEDGSNVTTDDEKAKMFNTYFCSVYTKEDLQSIPNKQCDDKASILSDIDIDETEVFELLKKLQADKSPGADGIHPRVLKECAAELSMPLTKLFRQSLAEGRLPESWKKANISPIFKKGDRSSVANYRPISLTSVCSKLMEKLIRNALLRHMIDNSYLSDYQHGFVHGRSCTTQLLKVVDQWTEILDQGGTIDAVYLDFAKAFDAVPHQRLLVKLAGYGVSGYVFEWIQHFLVDRTQRVGVAGTYSA